METTPNQRRPRAPLSIGGFLAAWLMFSLILCAVYTWL